MKLHIFTLGTILISSMSYANESINLDFIQNNAQLPSFMQRNVKYPKGNYYVDIIVNKKRIKIKKISISPLEESNGTLCFSKDFFDDVDIKLNYSLFDNQYDNRNKCYNIENKKHVNVEFDYINQKLNIIIPQAYQEESTLDKKWDFGIPGINLNYFADFGYANGKKSGLARVDFITNYDRWYFTGKINSRVKDDINEFEIQDLAIHTPIRSVKGDFVIGKSSTKTNLFEDFSFVGLGLKSNSKMLSNKDLTYAPVVRGVASSPSSIVVKQSGYTIYSRTVPAGPYELNDIVPSGNNDLHVYVTGSNGVTKESIYPISYLPELLRSGEYRYDFSVGEIESHSAREYDKNFLLGNFDYGFDQFTASFGTIVSDSYYSFGLGLSKSFGNFGAFSVNLKSSISEDIFDDFVSGVSYGIKYNNNFTESTNLQVVAYQYESENYVEFSDFSERNRFSNEKKSRLDINLSQQVDSFSISSSFWLQSYWNKDEISEGANISLGKNYNDINFQLIGSYNSNNYSYSSEDYSLTLNISIPFGDNKYYLNNGISTDENNRTIYTNSLSANVNDNLDYDIGLSKSSTENRYNTSLSYSNRYLKSHLGLSYSENNSSFSGGVSGSILINEKTGLYLTHLQSDSIAILNTDKIEGVDFNGTEPTDKNGNTIAYLNSFNDNKITMNVNSLPENVEPDLTYFNVVPVQGAVIWRDFSPKKVQRYILKLKNKRGGNLTGGEVFSENNVYLGMVDNNGVVLINYSEELIDLKEMKMIVKQGNNNSCFINIDSLDKNNKYVQEAVCEE